LKRLLLAAILAVLLHGLLFSTKADWNEKKKMKRSRPEPIILALYNNQPKKTLPLSPKRPDHKNVRPAPPAKIPKKRIASLVETGKPKKVSEKIVPIFKSQDIIPELPKADPIKELEKPFIEEHHPKEEDVLEIPSIPVMQSMDAYILEDIRDEPPVLVPPPLQVAVPIYKDTLTYPRIARRRGWEGTVILKVLVGVDGKVEDLQILESSGHGILDNAAKDSVRGWRFEPWKRGDESIEMWGKVIVSFKLK
jgi:protein TonB